MDADEIRQRLTEIPMWTLQDETLTKTFTFADFAAAWQWLNRVAVLAEELDHHPDIFVHWDTVTLTLFSHDVQRLTGRDFRLAKAIDAL